MTLNSPKKNATQTDSLFISLSLADQPTVIVWITLISDKHISNSMGQISDTFKPHSSSAVTERKGASKSANSGGRS